MSIIGANNQGTKRKREDDEYNTGRNVRPRLKLIHSEPVNGLMILSNMATIRTVEAPRAARKEVPEVSPLMGEYTLKMYNALKKSKNLLESSKKWRDIVSGSYKKFAVDINNILSQKKSPYDGPTQEKIHCLKMLPIIQNGKTINRTYNPKTDAITGYGVLPNTIAQQMFNVLKNSIAELYVYNGHTRGTISYEITEQFYKELTQSSIMPSITVMNRKENKLIILDENAIKTRIINYYKTYKKISPTLPPVITTDNPVKPQGKQKDDESS